MPVRASIPIFRWALSPFNVEGTVVRSGAPTNREEKSKNKSISPASVFPKTPSSKFPHQSSQCFSHQNKKSRKERKSTHSKTNALPTLSPNAFSAVASSVRRHSLSSNLRSAIPCSTSKIVSRIRTGKRSSGSSTFTPSALLWRTSLMDPNLCMVV
jgi:hypothetical protein